jgi:ABC-type sugar transport system ATPase subunit
MDIRLDSITMEFPGTRALDGVSVAFRTDEVHGLIGENGAGKSTLVSILGGSLAPTSGRIAIDGRAVDIGSPSEALAHGIAHVSQEGSLVPGLTGAENILLGAEPGRAGVIATGRLRAEAAALAKQWFPEVDLDLGQPVSLLPMAERKIIEIVRALRGEVKLLILDEPTATLPAREKSRLWQIIRSLPERGVGVVLISHFLSEIKALADRITVLRDGQLIATGEAARFSEAELVNLMLRRAGEGAAAGGPAGHRAAGEVVMRVAGWRVGRVEVPEFEIRAGEIVGLIGLTGSGHFGFARSLYAPTGATCTLCEIGGRPVRIGTGTLHHAGIALVPDQRMENALIGDWNLRENLAMVHPEHASPGAGILSRRREEAETGRVMRQLAVKAHSSRQMLKTLSGGNKQKISIGKWLYGAAGRYRLMIFIEPTEGVDVGTKAEIYAEMRRLADQGVAILIASSDLIEIEAIADRVIPFFRFAAGSEITRPQFSEASFIAAMSGVAA